MTVKYCTVEVEVIPQCRERLALRKQKLDRTDIPIVAAPANELHAVRINGYRRMACGDEIEYQVRFPIRDLIEGICAHGIKP